jgi:hypothetical protein
MDKRKIRWTLTALIVTIIIRSISPALAAGAPTHEANATATINRVHAVVPEGIQMVDQTIAILSKGWDKMGAAEQALFLQYYDPANTGTVDSEFVNEVLENFVIIRQKFDAGFAVKFAADNNQCKGMRLYYTNFISVFACPYLETEENTSRIARDLVHEVAHIALKVLDREYYHETSSAYKALTPRGHWAAELPLVGYLFSEIDRADTLHNPDTYAKFAADLVSLEAETLSTVNVEDEAPQASSISPEAMRFSNP